jgi:hypothetical protein
MRRCRHLSPVGRTAEVVTRYEKFNSAITAPITSSSVDVTFLLARMYALGISQRLSTRSRTNIHNTTVRRPVARCFGCGGARIPSEAVGYDFRHVDFGLVVWGLGRRARTIAWERVCPRKRARWNDGRSGICGCQRRRVRWMLAVAWWRARHAAFFSVADKVVDDIVGSA